MDIRRSREETFSRFSVAVMDYLGKILTNINWERAKTKSICKTIIGLRPLASYWPWLRGLKPIIIWKCSSWSKHSVICKTFKLRQLLWVTWVFGLQNTYQACKLHFVNYQYRKSTFSYIFVMLTTQRSVFFLIQTHTETYMLQLCTPHRATMSAATSL